MERKPQFDNGNYSEKRTLATEIVSEIRSLNPPGRFLKRVKITGDGPRRPEDEWEELSDDKAIHKACQVMRDINRPDREEKKRTRGKVEEEAQPTDTTLKQDTTAMNVVAATNELIATEQLETQETLDGEGGETIVTTETAPAEAQLDESVLATEEVLDNTLGSGVTEEKDVEMKEEVVTAGVEV
mmetsp:Transcript_31508/g.44725  ORF Transcript_31508/g.44725 Transcript_31508/m.44725 type:complete len:185 (+) Transcript_31508:61-615(+)